MGRISLFLTLFCIRSPNAKGCVCICVCVCVCIDAFNGSTTKWTYLNGMEFVMSESICLLYKPFQFVGVAPKIRRNCFRYLYRPNEKSQRHRILSRIMARLVESQISDGNFSQSVLCIKPYKSIVVVFVVVGNQSMQRTLDYSIGI